VRYHAWVGFSPSHSDRCYLLFHYHQTKQVVCRYQWPGGLRRGSAAARFLGLWVRISPGAWILSLVCCVFRGRGLCDELITINVWVVLKCVLFCIIVWIHNRKYKVSVRFFKDNQSSDPISVVLFKNLFHNIFSYLHLSFANILLLQIISTCSNFLILSCCGTPQCALIP
jgi:hypothetical protein